MAMPTREKKLVNFPNSPNFDTYIIYTIIYTITLVNFFDLEKTLQKLMRFFWHLGPPFSLFSFSCPFFHYSEFPLSSCTHKRLFNFLLLLDDDDDDDDDVSLEDLILARIVTRSCGNTFSGLILRLLLSSTNSCINW